MLKGVCVMKKVLFCFVLVLGFVLPASAEIFMKINDDENYLIYVDIASVEQRTSDGNDYIVAWVKFIPRGEMLKRKLKLYQLTSIGHMSEFVAFSKDLMLSQLLAARIYDEKGKMLYDGSSEFSPDKYEEVAPETYGERVYNQVMHIYSEKAASRPIFPIFQ